MTNLVLARPGNVGASLANVAGVPSYDDLAEYHEKWCVDYVLCLCGCGEPSKDKRRYLGGGIWAEARPRFLPGHDAKLHSLVLRIHRGKVARNELPPSEDTIAYLRRAPWMTPEIAKSLGL